MSSDDLSGYGGCTDKGSKPAQRLMPVTKPPVKRATRKAVSTPSGRTEPWRKTIVGELASKANSRKLVTYGGMPRFIKSEKARTYLPALYLQVPTLSVMFEEELRITVTVYYASNRPDLDISLLLDALQGRVYRNDRQVREQHIYHAIDRDNPRVEVELSLRNVPEMERSIAGAGEPPR